MTDLSRDELETFLRTFAQLNDAAQQLLQRPEDDGGPVFFDLMRGYFGQNPTSLSAVREVIGPFRYADSDVALEHLAAEDPDAQLLGWRVGDERWHATFADMLERPYLRQAPVSEVAYRSVPVGPDKNRRVVSFGIRFFEFTTDGETHRVAVAQRADNEQYGAEATVEVLAHSSEIAAAVLARLRELMDEHSVLRGKVISFGGSQFGRSHGSRGSLLTFVRRPDVPASAVVLPEGVLEKVSRHVVGIGAHRDALRRAGQHLKRGVLLYGPPGTGKTHTVRHLIGAAEGTTVILLTGQSLQYIALATDTARALQPAIVVLEDCDLVAEERSHYSSSPLLFEVLDSLDGLASDADVAFVLTTNRADILEPALAQRPGRVDLAVEIDKPDRDARLELLHLYARGLGFSERVLSEIADTVENTTASFAKELVRRSVLTALERGTERTDDDLREAANEMVADADTMTHALLGGSGEGGAGVDAHDDPADWDGE